MHDLSTHDWLGNWKPHLYLLYRTCGTALLASDVTILEGHSVTENDIRAFAKKLGKTLFDHRIKPEEYEKKLMIPAVPSAEPTLVTPKALSSLIPQCLKSNSPQDTE